MILAVTDSLKKEYGITLQPIDETKSLLLWNAHLFYFKRKKCILFRHSKTGLPILLHGIKKNDFKNLSKHLEIAIRRSLQACGFNREAIVPFMKQMDLDHFSFVKKVDRQAIHELTDFIYLIQNELQPINLDEIVQPLFTRNMVHSLTKVEKEHTIISNVLDSYLLKLTSQDNKSLLLTAEEKTIYLMKIQKESFSIIERTIEVPGNALISSLRRVIREAFELDFSEIYHFYVPMGDDKALYILPFTPNNELEKDESIIHEDLITVHSVCALSHTFHLTYHGRSSTQLVFAIEVISQKQLTQVPRFALIELSGRMPFIHRFNYRFLPDYISGQMDENSYDRPIDVETVKKMISWERF